MEETKKYVEIEANELARLQRLDGRVDAAQDYVNKNTGVYLDVVLDILGIDRTMYEIRTKKELDDYKNLLEDGDTDAESDCSA